MPGIGKIENLRQWQPGQSGNPGGRPKRKAITEELMNHADRPVTAEVAKQLGLPEEMIGWTYAQATSEMVWRRAMQGDPAAVDKIADRLEGKAQQSVELTGADGGPIQLVRKYERLSDEQIAQMVSIAECLQLEEAPATAETGAVVDAVATVVSEGSVEPGDTLSAT